MSELVGEGWVYLKAYLGVWVLGYEWVVSGWVAG